MAKAVWLWSVRGAVPGPAGAAVSCRGRELQLATCPRRNTRAPWQPLASPSCSGFRQGPDPRQRGDTEARWAAPPGPARAGHGPLAPCTLSAPEGGGWRVPSGRCRGSWPGPASTLHQAGLHPWGVVTEGLEAGRSVPPAMESPGTDLPVPRGTRGQEGHEGCFISRTCFFVLKFVFPGPHLAASGLTPGTVLRAHPKSGTGWGPAGQGALTPVLSLSGPF